MNKIKEYDYLIIGAGIMGLTIGYELRKKYPQRKIAIIEKEKDVALHASGRNSGVLHAGFYYTSNSYKAKFTRDGNKLMKEFCNENGIYVNNCQKVVVASNEEELKVLDELYQRGIQNGIQIKLINEEELFKIEPNAKTYKRALFSPTTASVNPSEVCQKLKEVLIDQNIDFYFNTKYLKKKKKGIVTNRYNFNVNFLINAAGLYADVIAQDFGYCKGRTIIPFKGTYLKYNGNGLPIKTNIYPVPNLLNPFLGVHYTITSDNHIKIGPTAIPAFWRENYNGFNKFNLAEFLEILYFELKLFLTNSFNFRSLVYAELKKYNKQHFAQLSQKLSRNLDLKLFDEWLEPGIRAQLLNKKSLELEMDFIIEGDNNSVHLLNAVSPAFTCSFAIAKYLITEEINA